MENITGRKPCTAIVLSAGQGKRMGSTVQKQYIELQGRPIVYYAMETFQQSDLIDQIVMVVGKGQEEYCRKEIVEKYGLTKVTQIVEGGAERYHSVHNGLKKVVHEGYVFIHDGARPFVTEEILERVYRAVCDYPACVVGMPVKDTIKIVDEDGFTKETPNRNYVWQVQTPQVFSAPLIRDAYHKIISSGEVGITDDAMVVEKICNMKSRLVEGSYENIKITTPGDLEIAEVFLKRRGKECDRKCMK